MIFLVYPLSRQVNNEYATGIYQNPHSIKIECGFTRQIGFPSLSAEEPEILWVCRPQNGPLQDRRPTASSPPQQCHPDIQRIRLAASENPPHICASECKTRQTDYRQYGIRRLPAGMISVSDEYIVVPTLSVSGFNDLASFIRSSLDKPCGVAGTKVSSADAA